MGAPISVRCSNEKSGEVRRSWLLVIRLWKQPDVQMNLIRAQVEMHPDHQVL